MNASILSKITGAMAPLTQQRREAKKSAHHLDCMCALLEKLGQRAMEGCTEYLIGGETSSVHGYTHAVTLFSGTPDFRQHALENTDLVKHELTKLGFTVTITKDGKQTQFLISWEDAK